MEEHLRAAGRDDSIPASPEALRFPVPAPEGGQAMPHGSNPNPSCFFLFRSEVLYKALQKKRAEVGEGINAVFVADIVHGQLEAVPDIRVMGGVDQRPHGF